MELKEYFARPEFFKKASKLSPKNGISLPRKENTKELGYIGLYGEILRAEK